MRHIPPRRAARRRAILSGMVYRPGETPQQAAQRQARDRDELRALAWCVQRNRYNRDRTRIEGGHRGKAVAAPAFDRRKAGL
jgi:hypothetical protein